MRGLTLSEYWSGFRNGSQMGLGTETNGCVLVVVNMLLVM